MTTIRVALEWYLNPDHLPLIEARRAAARDGGPQIELIAPDDHYDGFAALAAGEVDIVVNEPLHLLERHDQPLASLGAFFDTDGGVLITRAAQRRLLDGGEIDIVSPVSNPVTDGLCRAILAGWAERRGAAFRPGQAAIREAGFGHVESIVAGADAGWLAFANIELVDARARGLDVALITAADGGVPGFSALELIVRRDETDERRALLADVARRIGDAVGRLRADPEAAGALWREASGEARSPAGDAILADTLKRFVAPVRPDAERWRAIWAYMHGRGAEVVSRETFEAIFAA